MAKYTIQPVEFDLGEAKIGIIAARFNLEIVDKLLAGAKESLQENNICDSHITVTRVPGAFEIPIMAQKLAPRVTAIIALAAVIRGDTPHFDYVCSECASGVSRVSLDEGIPIIFGVLTTDNWEQAMQRAGGEHGNKGTEAALAAMEMITLHRRLQAQ